MQVQVYLCYKEMLNNLIGKYSSESLPLWMEVALHIPIIKKKYKARSVSEIQIFEDGIAIIEHGMNEQHVEYRYEDIRRIWFETYTSGSDENGNTSFRIDIIANNLDVLFTMKKTNCTSSNETLLLMRRLYELWEKEMMKRYELIVWFGELAYATNSALNIDE